VPIQNPTAVHKSGQPALTGDVQLVEGTNVTLTQTGNQITIAASASGGGLSYTKFTQDLGTAYRSGTFDLTGLSGLTADKVVNLVQTADAISSKGDARDEAEMDQIRLTGYVVDAATIRCYWQAPNVVVGTYAFAYAVSG
jgi:hypothetical protein